MNSVSAERIMRRALAAGFARNSFIWQGGEPTLLGVDFFRKIIEVQERFARPGQVVENFLQTNGLLLDEPWCRFLGEKNFLVGLSLDGPREIHDRYRCRPDGQGTYDAILEKIALLRRHEVAFNILSLLTEANIHNPEKVYSFFRRQGFSFLQFIPCFEKDLETGGSLPFSVAGPDLGTFYCTLFDLWMKDGFPQVSIRLFEDLLLYIFEGVHSSCSWMPACDSYLLVEHNGDCYPCDFYVYPEWKLGNILNDPLSAILEHPRRKTFAQRKSLVSPECPTCRLYPFCQGDCPKFRQTGAGSGPAKSEYCTAWRMLSRHIRPRLDMIRERIQQARKGNPLAAQAGRNDPCPCGSGKKFKKCCGLNS